jgi:hypothetical protein
VVSTALDARGSAAAGRKLTLYRGLSRENTKKKEQGLLPALGFKKWDQEFL